MAIFFFPSFFFCIVFPRQMAERPARSGGSWVQRKIVQPIRDVISQGITPHSLALSIAFGVAGGIVLAIFSTLDLVTLKMDFF